MERKCLECETVLSGRVDKKFCSDYCRNAYNNRQRQDYTNEMRNINNILRKNRKILADLAPNDKSKSTRENLYKLGFNFDYHTNTLTTKTGNFYKFCYDYGYLQIDEENFAIVKKN